MVDHHADDDSPRAIADFFIVQQGNIPVLITAPHGGSQTPGELDPRTNGTLLKDLRTKEITQQFNTYYGSTFSLQPYVVIADVHRNRIDFNREHDAMDPSQSEAYEDPDAAPYYQYYHNTIRGFVDEIRTQWSTGLLIDIHGQAADADVIFRGTDVDSIPDGNPGSDLDSTVENLLMNFGDDALNGPNGLLGALAAQSPDYTITPDLADPYNADDEDNSYDGGYTVKTYGSHHADGIDAIQLEFGSDFRSVEVHETTATHLAIATHTFQTNYLTAVPEPSTGFALVAASSMVMLRRRKRR